MSKAQENVEIIDLEDFSKEGKTVPKGKRYRFKVDNEKFVTNSESLSAEEILKIAGVNKEEFYLQKKVKEKGLEVLCFNEKVDFTEPGVESFKTLRVNNDVILIILTTQGKWKVIVSKATTVQGLIQQVVQHFGFSTNGQYELRLKVDPNRALDPNATIGSIGADNCDILIFTDLGMAAWGC